MADLNHLEFTCGPEAAVGQYPCMNVLDDHQLLAVLVVIMHALTGAREENDSANTIAACNTCWMKLTPHEKLVALNNILLSWGVHEELISTATDDIVQSTSCLLSLSDQELMGIFLCDLCTFTNALSLSNPV